RYPLHVTHNGGPPVSDVERIAQIQMLAYEMHRAVEGIPYTAPECFVDFTRSAGAAITELLDARNEALRSLRAALDEANTERERLTAELVEAGQRWAYKADELGDAVGCIQDITEHANPIGHDADGYVAVGYTVTVGAVHRAIAWLQGAY